MSRGSAATSAGEVGWVGAVCGNAVAMCRGFPPPPRAPCRRARGSGCEVARVGSGVYIADWHADGASQRQQDFTGLCARRGIRRIRFHDLRHSCATLLYERGVPIENIHDVLGHSTPVITKLLYVDGTEKMQRAAADRLGSLFEGLDESRWGQAGVKLGPAPRV